jgi:hypothetical protein
MSDDSGYEVIEELDLEEPVPQIDDFRDLQVDLTDDFRDTDPMGVPSFRAQTSSDWPPAPPLPADVELAQGTLTEGEPVQRNARFYAVVRRPTTSSETDD